MIEVDIVGVQVEVPANTPVLLLRERGGRERVLPIYIGGDVASAIHHAMNGDDPPRPLTHDLFRDVLEALDATLSQVLINDLQSGTYFAELVIDVSGSRQTVSARPSDAIALAVRTSSPVFVDDRVLDEGGREPDIDEDDEDGPESEALVDEFRKFIDEVSADDFEA